MSTAPRFDVQNAQAQAPSGAPTGLAALKQTASSTFSDPTLLKALLVSALGSGAIGGALSARTPRREGETRSQRMKRILLNAAGSGAAGAGVVGAGALGYNLFNKAPEAEGAVSALTNLHHSLSGRLGSAGLLGYLGNRMGARSENKAILNNITSAPGIASARNPKKIITPGITADEVKRTFAGGSDAAAANHAKEKLTQRIVTLNPGVTSRDATNMVRSIGEVPAGESPIGAFARRNFSPLHGASPSRLLGKTSPLRSNRRFTGGALGAGVGLATPELVDIALSLAGKLGPADSAAPADPGLMTRPIRPFGS